MPTANGRMLYVYLLEQRRFLTLLQQRTKTQEYAKLYIMRFISTFNHNHERERENRS